MTAISIDDFEISDRLGRGRFGHVFRVRKKDNNKEYALKVLFKQELLDNNILQQVMKEVEVQYNLRHKYILRLRYVTQDAKRVYLITDLSHYGNLYSYLRKLNRFPEHIAGKYMRQLLHAVTYLHQNRIVHRDIKPENLLLSTKGNLLLSDFGWSTPVDDRGRHTVCGTPEYFPPEMLKKQSYDESVDAWTCGVLCFEMLTGNTPFISTSDDDKCNKIMTGTFTCPKYLSPGSVSFIKCALVVDPIERYSAGELFLHEWTQIQSEDAMSIVDYDNSLPATAISKGGSIASLEDEDFIENIKPFQAKPFQSAGSNDSCI